MTHPSKDFYTTRELADTLKVNIMTVYRYIKKGRIKAHKIGKDFRIGHSEFERFLKATSTK
jgi:putative molybdopterin biosynthesis protein